MLEDDDPTNMHPDTAQLCRVIYQVITLVMIFVQICNRMQPTNRVTDDSSCTIRMCTSHLCRRLSCQSISWNPTSITRHVPHCNVFDVPHCNIFDASQCASMNT